MNDSSTQASEDQSTNPTSKKNDNYCSNNSKGMMMIVYKECLKNHAAALGAHSTDGCGEFMPSSVEDTLLCSACGCHRNFHRKEVDMGGTIDTYLPKCHYCSNHTSSVLPTTQLLECHQLHEGAPVLRGPHISRSENVGPAAATPSGNDGKKVKVEEEEMMKMMNKKKRHRTRFTNEQKEKMLEFAEKVGWRMQKVNEGLVQQLCQEVGIKKKVLKVWMHNNKPLLAKKTVCNSTPSDHNASDSTN